MQPTCQADCYTVTSSAVGCGMIPIMQTNTNTPIMDSYKFSHSSGPDFSAAKGSPDVIEFMGRFYVNMDRPGFNSRTNTRDGYATKQKALDGELQRVSPPKKRRDRLSRRC